MLNVYIKMYSFYSWSIDRYYNIEDIYCQRFGKSCNNTNKNFIYFCPRVQYFILWKKSILGVAYASNKSFQVGLYFVGSIYLSMLNRLSLNLSYHSDLPIVTVGNDPKRKLVPWPE